MCLLLPKRSALCKNSIAVTRTQRLSSLSDGRQQKKSNERERARLSDV